MTMQTDGETATVADTDSLLAVSDSAQAAQTTEVAQTETATDADPNAWLPEKFRVTKEDGTLDEAASSRKLAESYAALEKHKGPLSQAPESPEAYELKVEGLEGEAVEQFKADPMFQDFAKAMHAAGLSNDQLNAVVSRYIEAAPQLLAANEQLSIEEAKAELSKVWQTDGAMQSGIAASRKVIETFGAQAEDVAGSQARLLAKYGKDPDFIAFTGAIGAELKEDRPVSSASAASAADIESLMKGEAYWKPEHPDHTKVKEQVSAHFARQHGTRKR